MITYLCAPSKEGEMKNYFAVLICGLLLLPAYRLFAAAAEPVVGTPVVFGSVKGGWVAFKSAIPDGQSFLGLRLLPPKGEKSLAPYPQARWIDATSLRWAPEVDKTGDGFYCSLAFINDQTANGWPTVAFAATNTPNTERSISFATTDKAQAGTALIMLTTSLTEHTNDAGELDPNTSNDLITTIAVGEQLFTLNKPCVALRGYNTGATNESTIKFSAVPITLPIIPSTRYTITLKSAPFAQKFAWHMINGLLLPTLAESKVTAAPIPGISTPRYAKIDQVLNGRGSITVQELNDKDGMGGKSLKLDAAKKTGGYAADSYSYPPYPGRYKFTFHLKIDTNTGDGVVATVSPVFPGVHNPTLPIKASDFHAAYTYQDFTVEGVVPEGTFGAYSVNFDPAPNHSLWWDYTKYELLEPYDDQRIIAEWYPEFTPPVNFTRVKGAETLRTHVIYGSAYESSGIREAMHLLGKQAPAVQPPPSDIRFYQPPGPRKVGEWRETMFIDHGQVKDRAPGFPHTQEEFAVLDLLIMANVPGRAPNAVERVLLHDWVKTAGGGMLLTGGMTALGKGFVDGTMIEAMLPVELTGVSDIRAAKDGRLVVNDAKLAAIIGATPLATKFYQQVKVKPGADVLLATADGAPLLVCWSYGAGHVAIWTGVPLGSIDAPQQAWWKAEVWPAVVAEVLNKIAGK